jgi:hypothetical protein
VCPIFEDSWQRIELWRHFCKLKATKGWQLKVERKQKEKDDQRMKERKK